MKNDKMNELMSLVKGLTKSEQKSLINNIMNMMSTPSIETLDNSCNAMIEENGRPDCPHCRAKAKDKLIVKHGFRNGRQSYQCKACGKRFMATTNTTFENTRKDADVWYKFIEMTINGYSLKKCSEECNIAYYTAFSWRHKILNVFRHEQEEGKMSGIVEMDEMLVPISYKGNHVQGAFGKRRIEKGAINDMPRNSYKRGSDNKSKSSDDKVCVFCMVENSDKTFFAATPGVGFMKNNMLDAIISPKISKNNTLLLVDQYKITKNYLNNNGYKFMSLLSNTSDNPHDHKPETHGDFHLQHVNAMHHHIRVFLCKYYGVSSKYLENYLSLFVWIKNMHEKYMVKREERTFDRLALPNSYTTDKELKQFPAVPHCA